MGCRPSVVSPDSRPARCPWRGVWISRRKPEMAGVLRGLAACGSRRRIRMPDRCEVRNEVQLSREVSRGFLHYGLDVRPIARGAPETEGVDLHGEQSVEV